MPNQKPICRSSGIAYFDLCSLDNNAQKVAHQSWLKFMEFGDGVVVDDEGFVIDTSFAGFKKNAEKSGLVFSKNGNRVFWTENCELVDTESHSYEH